MKSIHQEKLKLKFLKNYQSKYISINFSKTQLLYAPNKKLLDARKCNLKLLCTNNSVRLVYIFLCAELIKELEDSKSLFLP